MKSFSAHILGQATIIAIATLFTSCEKELEFKYHAHSPILVIEGNLTQNGSRVALTETVPVDHPITNLPVTDANVVITDITDKAIYVLDLDDEGYYSNPMSGIPGHVYTLEVTRNDKKYASTSIMYEGVVILSLSFEWIKMPYDYVAALQVAFSDSDIAADGYWIRIYRNSEPYNWGVVSSRNSQNGTINYAIMTTRQNPDENDGDAILDNDIITVSVAPISHSMFNYLQALIAGNNNGPEMFVGDFCLGYFLATSVASDSVIFSAAEIPYPD